MGQILWLTGAGFLIAGLFFLKSYLEDYWHGTMSADYHAKYTAIILFVLGTITMFIGINMEYKWVEVEVIK